MIPRALPVVLAAALALCAAPASALMQITIEQSGTDVVVNYSGTLDASGYDYLQTFSNMEIGAIDPSAPSIGRASTVSYDVYGFDFSPSESWDAFGAEGGEAGTMDVFGDVFGFQQDDGADIWTILAPGGYQFGDALAGGFTFADATLSGLGLFEGVYTYALPSDSITLTVGAAAVPAPAAAPLLAAALGGLGLAARRRRRAA